MSKFTFTTLSSDEHCNIDSLSLDLLSQIIDDISAVEGNTGTMRSVINGDFTLHEIEALEKSYDARIITTQFNKEGSQ
jgi:hypothetical protein